MSKITLRYQQVGDAKRFFEILTNPHFIYFPTKPKSIDDEKKWLRETTKKRKANLHWNYTILYNSQIVGGIGMRIRWDRQYLGEIGYFVDEKYWNKGIASKAVALIEREGFAKMGLKRIEILMQPANKASEKVALKNGYLKEGKLKKVLKMLDGELKDALLYTKTI